MKCIACHEQMEEKHGEIELRIHGQLFLVKNVTYQECPSCGERVLSSEVSQNIFEKIARKEYMEKQIVMPVVEGNSVEVV